MGGGLPREVESPTPVSQSRRGGRGAGAHGGRGSTRHRVVRRRGGARRRSVSAHRGSIWECCGGGDRRHSSVRRALEKEEARLLHLEVSSRSSRRSGFEGLELSFLSSCSQGGADRPRPHACQSAQVGRVHTHEKALVKGATGGRKRGDDGRATPQRGHGHEAAAGGDGRDADHDYGNHRADDSASVRPRGRRSSGCGGDS
jgi:hypothetical protein